MPRLVRMRSCASIAVVLLVAGTVAGCAEDRPEIRPGACVAGETGAGGHRAPDLTTVVPCTTPHRYEIYDIVDLPVPPSDSAQSQGFAALAQRRCASSLLSATLFDSVTVNGHSAEAVGLVPAMRGVEAPRYTVIPWSGGRRQVMCSARMKALTQSARDNALLLTLARSDGFPVALRQCRGYDADRRNIAPVPCSRRHVSELLFTFQADEAMGGKFVETIVASPTAPMFDQLDRVCSEVLAQLLGAKFDQELRGFGSVARRWTDTDTPVRCDVGPVDFKANDLPPGSLMGTDDLDVKLHPVP